MVVVAVEDALGKYFAVAVVVAAAAAAAVFVVAVVVAVAVAAVAAFAVAEVSPVVVVVVRGTSLREPRPEHSTDDALLKRTRSHSTAPEAKFSPIPPIPSGERAILTCCDVERGVVAMGTMTLLVLLSCGDRTCVKSA